MEKELFNNILEELEARSPWENRCIQSYEMRHNGIARRNKPWPDAADLHYPLADMMIEKLKPFFMGQIYSSELVATFRSLLASGTAHEQIAAQWFHYQLMEKSNFEIELHRLVDTMLTYGTAVMKSYYDAEAERPSFAAVDPLFVIVPTYANSLKESDWVVHVQQYSKAAYKRMKAYRQDDEFLKKITGRGDEQSRGRIDQWTRVKYRREGLTCGVNSDQVVVWEVYEKDDEGEWLVHTVSPLAPDEPIREASKLPYLHGELPFVEVPNEIKDRGFYSARGVVERVKAFELYACKVMSEKADANALYANPMFAPPKDGFVPNTNNLRPGPGMVLSAPLEAVRFGEPPMSLDRELTQTREIAEQLAAIPDFGVNNPYTKDRRSATEVSYISSLMQQNIGSRARLFKHFIGELMRLHYHLLLQYAGADLNFFYRGTLGELPADALHTHYQIEPRISGDSFNKEIQFQKKSMRFQMLQGNPYIDQGALVRGLIEADDPQEVKTLYVDPQEKQADQQEAQAGEITKMLIGYPCTVKPEDDDAAHLQGVFGFLGRRMQTGEGVGPELAGLLLQHAGGHLESLKHKDPEAAKMLEPQLRQAGQALQGIMMGGMSNGQAA